MKKEKKISKEEKDSEYFNPYPLISKIPTYAPKGLKSVGDECFLNEEGILFTLERSPISPLFGIESPGIRFLKKQEIPED